MHLKIKAENDAIRALYENHTEYHPDDSGLDLFVPEDVVIPAKSLGYIIDMKISCEPFVDKSKQNHMAYYIYPRSSMGAKTPLRLSNSVGIMDSGYRGSVKAIVDNNSDEDYRVSAITRLVQICDPMLRPISYEMVNSLSETSRGSGGLGSTGQ